MRLFSEIIKLLGVELGAGVQYTVFEGQGGYFQNVKRITEFSQERIVLRGRKGSVCIEGSNLSIGKYYVGDVTVKGDIVRVERQ